MKPFFLAVLFPAFLLLLSCFSTKYLPSRTYLLSPSKTRDNLLVFLPGRGSDMNDFKKYGLLETIKSGGLPVDCISADANIFYYMDRSLSTRLDADVFSKAELSNYKNYWFIGNSMGALGAFLYVQKHPGKIKGIILLGPFLGEGQVPDEIERSGGLLRWESKVPAGSDYIRDIWVYLKNCIQDTEGKYPRIVFIAGKNDRYHKIQDLAAQALPADMVFWSQGDHDWDAWIPAFSDFIKSDTAKRLFISK